MQLTFPISSVNTDVRTIYGEESPEYAELEWRVRPDDPPEGTGGGYVVDCLRSARMVVDHGPYEQVVKAAIALGNDTDTTACVVGGIAGVRDGVAAIPQRWRDVLRASEIVEPLVARLVGH